MKIKESRGRGRARARSEECVNFSEKIADGYAYDIIRDIQHCT
jgi:hypothetical protein